jgi:hypothetical protein
MQLIETLCAKAPETIQLASYRCITLPEDLVVLDEYTVGCGRLSPNRPNLEPIGRGCLNSIYPASPQRRPPGRLQTKFHDVVALSDSGPIRLRQPASRTSGVDVHMVSVIYRKR